MDRAHLKVWGGWVDHTAVAIEIGEPEWHNRLVQIEEAAEHASDREERLYVVFQANAGGLRWLQEFCPQGETVRMPSAVTPGLDYYALVVCTAPPWRA